MRTDVRKGWWIPLLLIALAGGLFALFGKGARVGDGDEYYAMMYAWSETLRPYLSEESLAAFEAATKSDVVDNQVPPSALNQHFPQLTTRTEGGDWQMDLPHFWLYSLMAALVFKVFAPLGVTGTGAFLILHFMMVAVAIGVSWRYYRWIGVIAFYLLWLCSPMIWFSNKVHTEFMSFVVGVIAINWVLQRSFIFAAICFALLGAQNPLFLVLVLVCLIGWYWEHRREPIIYADMASIVVAVLISALHPLYYLIRHGALTPQFLTGAASSSGVSFTRGLVPLFDPIVGLFVNWPVGLLVLCLGIGFGMVRRRWSIQWWVIPGAAIWIFLALYSHGSTLHLNHGAVVTCSRYATWYIPLFFPVTCFAVESMGGLWKNRSRRKELVFIYLVFGVSLFLSGGILIKNAPSLKESYWLPTAFSKFQLRFFPGIYDMYPQIFVDRVIYGAPVPKESWCISATRDFRKVLIDTYRLHDFADSAVRLDKLGFNMGAVLQSWLDIKQDIYDPRYSYLEPSRRQWKAWRSEDSKSGLRCFDLSKQANERFLGSGWSRSDGNGRWLQPTFEMHFPSDEFKGEINGYIVLVSRADMDLSVSAGGDRQKYSFVSDGCYVVPFSIASTSASRTVTVSQDLDKRGAGGLYSSYLILVEDDDDGAITVE